jgi:hypothetical protein
MNQRGLVSEGGGGGAFTTEADIIVMLEEASIHPSKECMLTLSYSEVMTDLTCDGIPQVNLG